MPRALAHMLASPDDVEQQFYEALAEADLDKLMALWAEEEEIMCVHPAGPRMVGTDAVRLAFEAVFVNGPVQVQPHNVWRTQNLACAIHSVMERIEMPGPAGTRVGWVMATNVFVHTEYGWRLVAHHASPATADEPQELSVVPAVLH
jgi:ketosteroid isomerase-like protein